MIENRPPMKNTQSQKGKWLYREESIRIGDKLKENEIDELKEIIRVNKEAFSLKEEIGNTNKLSHKIELLDNTKTLAEPLRRRLYEHVEETRRQIKSMLEEGIIEPSDSPWASATLPGQEKVR